MAVLVAVACAVTGASAQRVQPAAARADEIRGLWVLRSSLATPQRIAELIRVADAGGYNTLLVQVRGRGDAYYTSQIEPRAEELRGASPGFDPLKETIDRAHAAGLRVHAWFNTNLVASATRLPTDPKHVAVRHPEWLMVPQPLAGSLLRRAPSAASYIADLARWSRQHEGQVEGLYLSPITDAAQDYTVSVVKDLLSRYALDGLHLDYIRYPTPDFDVSAASLAAFAARQSARMTDEERRRLEARQVTDPLIWIRTYPEGWDAFRRDRLTMLVTRIRALVDERPGLTLSAAVLPDPEDARRRKLQDWSGWAERKLLDAICPMAYATDVNTFRQQVEAAVRGAHGQPVWAGIGAWRLPATRTASAVQAARQRGAKGILLFSYDSLLTTGRRGSYFTALRPAIVTDEP